MPTIVLNHSDASITTPTWFLYIIENAQGQLYTGITTDVSRRFQEHQSNRSKTARSLKGKGPLILRYQQAVGTHSQALKLEYRCKKLTRQKKMALISGQKTLHQLIPDA
ncbi:MAG: GIY-YIG nuclease family protein [Ferrimonas sp.]